MNRAQRAARLGMIRVAVESAVNSGGLKRGKEQGKYKQLIKWVDREIMAMNLPAGYYRTKDVRKAVAEIERNTGVKSQGKGAATLLSFLSAMVEGCDFHSRITEILNELAEYYKAGGRIASVRDKNDPASDRLEERVR